MHDEEERMKRKGKGNDELPGGEKGRERKEGMMGNDKE